MGNGAYRSKKIVMEMMAAFSLYLDEGMRAVQKMYPQHVSFVRQHKDKSQAEVKKELLNHHAAL